MTRREAVARAIYMTHWRSADPLTCTPGAPVWEQASEAVREFVLAQADSALRTLRIPYP